MNEPNPVIPSGAQRSRGIPWRSPSARMAGSLDFARDDEPVRHGSSAIPRAIEVHIEELVLYGFQPNDRWRIGDALEAELRRLLANQGFPDSWRNNPEKVYAGKVHLTNRAQIGRQIAAAIHGGARQ